MVRGNRVITIETLFFGDITKKAFGNSTQKLYFIRNNSFLPLIHTSRLELLINYCHLHYMTQ